MESVVYLILTVIGFIIFCGLGFWLLSKAGFDAPFDKYARWGWVLICFLVLLGFFAGWYPIGYHNLAIR